MAIGLVGTEHEEIAMENKIVEIMKSRKFWASIIGLLVAFGLLEGGDEAKVVEAIVVIATAASYVIGTGLEDMGKAK